MFHMDDSNPERPRQPAVNTVHPEAQPPKEAGGSPVNPPTAPYVQPSPEGQPNRKDCRRDQTPWWKYAMELVAILIGGCVAIIYWRQLDTMQRQLEMADRPWVKDTVRSSGDFMANNGAFSWAVTIRAENVGHSVATAIFPETKLIAVHGADFIDGPRQQAKELCDKVSDRFEKVKNDPSVWGLAIFPGDYADLPSSPILWPSQIKDATFDGGVNLGTSVFPILIGCVEYHYATSEKPHKTWFVYTLSHKDDPTLQSPTRVFFSVGKTIPSADMVLTKAAQFAD